MGRRSRECARWWVISAAVLLQLLVVPGASAEAPPSPNNLTELYANTCMRYFHSQQTLREKMQKVGIAVPAENLSAFLQGRPGDAWYVDLHSGRYVVALHNTMCSVYARGIDPGPLHSQFVQLVGTAPSPLEAHEQHSPVRQVTDPSRRTTAYTWTRETDDSELMFLLTTTDDASATIQAMATMGVVNKEPAATSP